MNIERLLGSPQTFLKHLFAALADDGVDVARFELDHICYRVGDLSRYQALKDQISLYGQLLRETIINGRPISSFQLKDPIIFQNRKIYVLELPAPKQGSAYQEGYEHVEFVIDQDFKGFMDQYPNLKFETKALQKKVNADIQLKYDSFSVKFHQQSLAKVIEAEAALRGERGRLGDQENG